MGENVMINSYINKYLLNWFKNFINMFYDLISLVWLLLSGI